MKATVLMENTAPEGCGLARFFQINTQAQVYARPGGEGDYYAIGGDGEEIGLFR